MAFPSDLDSDLGIGYGKEGEQIASVREINVDDVADALHQNLDVDLAKVEKDGKKVQKFFDYMALHILIPWINALVSVVNKLKERMVIAETTVSAAAQNASDAAQSAATAETNAIAAAGIASALQEKAENGEFDGEDGATGVGIRDISLMKSGGLLITLTNGKTISTESVKGEPGDSIASTEYINGMLRLVLSSGEKISVGKINGIANVSISGKTLLVRYSDGTTQSISGIVPVKGTDYFTATEKQEFINTVLAGLPDGNEVAY